MSTPDPIEVHPGLYVGWRGAYEHAVRHLDGWYVVHAAKEPYHRQTSDGQHRGFQNQGGYRGDSASRIQMMLELACR